MRRAVDLCERLLADSPGLSHVAETGIGATMQLADRLRGGPAHHREMEELRRRAVRFYEQLPQDRARDRGLVENELAWFLAY